MSAKVCVTRFKENRAAFLVLTPMEDCVRWIARIKIWSLKFGGEPQWTKRGTTLYLSQLRRRRFAATNFEAPEDVWRALGWMVLDKVHGVHHVLHSKFKPRVQLSFYHAPAKKSRSIPGPHANGRLRSLGCAHQNLEAEIRRGATIA